MTHLDRRMSLPTFLLLCAAILVYPAIATSSYPSGSGTQVVVDGDQYAPDEIIVRFNTDVAPDAESLKEIARQVNAMIGAALKKDLGFHGLSGLQVVQVSNGTSLETALTLYRNNPYVLYAEPNYQVSIATVPNDPAFPLQWALNNPTSDVDIDAPEAWSISQGSNDVVIAVIDSGVDYTHTDLAANIWNNADEIAGNGIDDDRNGYIDDIRGWDFYSNDNNPTDDNGHGTHCAGIIGASGNNEAGISGVNWQVKIMPLKFLSASGSGSVIDAAEALWYAKRNGATISSHSYGGTGYSQTLKDAIDNTGILAVCAAGNSARDNDKTAFYPASYNSPNIISVAASDRYDNLASYSNYGATSVDVVAPGSSVYSTYKSGTFKNLSGTSMATPHVAGIAGLVKSVAPGMSASELKATIMSSVDKKTQFSTKAVSKGRVNAYNALTSVVATDFLSVTSISPGSGFNDTTSETETITGTGFSAGSTVLLRKAGEEDIRGSDCSIMSAALMTCTFSLAGATPGSWDVVVTNTAGQSATLVGGYTISAPPAPEELHITGITPSNAYNNGTVSITNLSGTGFVSGTKVALQITGQSDINATSVVIVNSRKITCNLDLNGRQAGVWDVVVTSPSGQSAILTGGFTIATPPLLPDISINGISPSSGYNNGTISITNLSGNGFISGTKVALQRTGQTDINATSVIISGLEKITCNLDLNGKQAGAWDVVVTSPSGKSASLTGGFTIVTPPLPSDISITGITPSKGYNNGTVKITNLAGTGFVTGTKVALRRTGQADINATSVIISSSQKITCSLNLKGKQAGAWDVVVTTRSGETATHSGGFTILETPVKLSVTSISPNSGIRGKTVNITSLAGTGFTDGATVNLQRTGKADIIATNPGVISASKMTCSFFIPSSTSTGYWNVRVTNPDGRTAMKYYAFIVR